MKKWRQTAIGALTALLSLSATVAAQTMPPWSAIPYPAMGKGVAACDHLGDQGDVFCFGLRCSAADNTPEWFTYQVGGDSVEGDVRVNLIVDGRSHSTLFAKQGKTPQGEWAFTASYDAASDRSIIEQLKSGAALYVLVGGASGAQLSLRGSSREIDRAFAMCRAGDQSQPAATSAKAIAEPNDAVLAVDPDAVKLAVKADQLPKPVQAVVDEIAAMCGSGFQTTGRSPDAFLAEDIDGDGIYDFLLDHAQFCPSEILTMCGASHCPMTLFVSAKGDWRRFDYILQGYEEFSEKGFLLQCNTPGRKAGVFMENGQIVHRNC